MITTEERKYLLSEMKEILDEYDHCYETFALEKIIDTWAENKADLIEAFKKHPNYLEGKFMIAFDMDYDREIDRYVSQEFSCWLHSTMREMRDALPTEVKEIEDIVTEGLWGMQYHSKDSYSQLPEKVAIFLTNLEHRAERTIRDDDAKMLMETLPNAHIQTGMKMSRAVNKLCTYLGYNKHSDYNRMFAKYADSLSPLRITRHTILSINPIDYLTMSIGNSWSSCHTINRNDGGCYSSGTISYMLDTSSMVFYTVDAGYNGNEYFSQPKITRQMFYYGEEKLVQSRLYPQSNDYNSIEIYKNCRQIVQDIIALIFDFPNYWTVSKGTQNAGKYIISEGTHYQDYDNFENCTLSRLKDNGNENCFTVGHDPICIECGNTHSTDDSINCCHGNGYYCECCESWIDADDVYWIDGSPYCCDCVEYCSDCGEHYLEGDVSYVESENKYVCNHCLEQYYEYCHECGELHDRENMTYIESESCYVCDDCLKESYTTCSYCGDYEATETLHLTANGDMVCGYCLEHNYFTCEHCGKIYPDCENAGDDICDECYDKLYTTCDHCGADYLSEDMVEYDGEIVCMDCLKEILKSKAEAC